MCRYPGLWHLARISSQVGQTRVWWIWAEKCSFTRKGTLWSMRADRVMKHVARLTARWVSIGEVTFFWTREEKRIREKERGERENIFIGSMTKPSSATQAVSSKTCSTAVKRGITGVLYSPTSNASGVDDVRPAKHVQERPQHWLYSRFGGQTWSSWFYPADARRLVR